MNQETLDPTILREKQGLISQIAAWANVAAVAAVGLRLGLYKVLGDSVPVTAAALAAKTGYNERLLMEWLRGQCAAGLIEHEGNETFRLLPEVASLLSDDETLAFVGAALLNLPPRWQSLGMLEESFRTGRGYGWDELGPDMVAGTERARRAWFSYELIPNVLPLLDGVSAKLTSGAEVADVGCGAGLAILEMAKQFPASTFHGYEVSALSLQRAEESRVAAGISNVQFREARSTLPPGAFDLVLTLDCMHDMSHPEVVAADIRGALKPDGTWFIMDVDSKPTFQENLNRGGVLAANGYAVSMLVCLPSSMAEDGSLGFGTFGLPEPAMRKIALDAGFGQFQRVEPGGRWALYEVRI